jgi:hypothetical protein
MRFGSRRSPERPKLGKNMKHSRYFQMFLTKNMKHSGYFWFFIRKNMECSGFFSEEKMEHSGC